MQITDHAKSDKKRLCLDQLLYMIVFGITIYKKDEKADFMSAFLVSLKKSSAAFFMHGISVGENVNVTSL